MTNPISSFFSKNLLPFRATFFYLQLFSQYINYIYFNQYSLDVNIKQFSLSRISLFLSYQWYCQYKSIVDIIAIDFPMRKARFRVVYPFLSYLYVNRIFLSLNLRENSRLPSLTSHFFGTTWQEREVWDLFGIYFHGNKDLRRILTDYGFSGHPLRKDFPLTGFYELLYDDRKKQVIYRSVSLAQEFRNFTIVNPWVTLKDKI